MESGKENDRHIHKTSGLMVTEDRLIDRHKETTRTAVQCKFGRKEKLGRHATLDLKTKLLNKYFVL